MGTISGIPEELKPCLQRSKRRFLFNVKLIEEKYCKKTSGLVFDLQTDQVLFDEELCTAEDDKSVKKLVSRQKKSLMKQSNGTAILSSPYVDPAAKGLALKRCLKLNKLFDNLMDKKPTKHRKLKETNSKSPKNVTTQKFLEEEEEDRSHSSSKK
uniref:Uncharacterized protein n=1 Tax=Ditylenchus dipsaci TaxID=166011 RepID=A0A915CV47_9BILA